MYYFIQVIDFSFEIISFLVVVHIILSWFRVDPGNPIIKFIGSIVEPILKMIRDKMPKTGMIDLSPLVLLLGLEVIRALIYSLINAL